MLDNEIVTRIKVEEIYSTFLDLFVTLIVEEIEKEEEFGCMVKILPDKELFAKKTVSLFRQHILKNLENKDFVTWDDVIYKAGIDAFNDIQKWCRLQNVN